MQKKALVLMPDRLVEFIPALAVLSSKDPEPDIELTLIVQEKLLPLCSILSPFKAVSFRRDSKSDLERLLNDLQNEEYFKQYNCSHSIVASWLSKMVDATIKRSVSDLSLKYSAIGETSETHYSKKHDITSDYMQFSEVPYLAFEQYSIAYQKIKLRLKRLIKPQNKRYHHVTEIYSHVLEVHGFKPDQWRSKKIAKDAEYEGMIVLCPGSVRGAGRQWPYYKDIVRLVPSQEFVILGTEFDTEIAKLVAPHLPHRVRNLAGKVSLDKAASIIAGASVVVANDSGFLQLAGFLGVPAVGIFGATSANKNKPLGLNLLLVNSKEMCSPCEKQVCNNLNDSCMTKVLAERIVEEMFSWQYEVQEAETVDAKR